jgi:hypothetical protein
MHGISSAGTACKVWLSVHSCGPPQAVQRELKSEKQQRERAASATRVLESEKASLQAQQAALQAQKASLQVSSRMTGTRAVVIGSGAVRSAAIHYLRHKGYSQ